MISTVRGTLSYFTENKVEIDLGSIGFEVYVPQSLIPELPPIGEDVTLYTSMQVKEDDITLYGFLTRDELELFKMLITVSGIGPKGALGILSVMTPEDLRYAIISEDISSIAKAPGIGKKTAEKLIIELRDKMERTVISVSPGSIEKPVRGESSSVTEAVMALTELGFQSKDAYKAVKSVENEGEDVGDLLKAALKVLGRG